MKRQTIVYTYRGLIERGSLTRGRPSYRWCNGYSATSPEGHVYYPWGTKRECQREAKARGAKAVFVVPESTP